MTEDASHPLSRGLCKPHSGQKFSINGSEYILGGKLGDGAAALVRRAEKVGDRGQFAVKFLAPDPKYIDQEVFDDVAARFRREGQRSQQLLHDCLVRVYAYEENTGGRAFVDRTP